MQAARLLVLLSAVLGLYFFWPFVMGASLFEKTVSLLYFAVLLYAAGYSVTRGIAFAEDPLELHLMRTGFGLAALPMAFVLLDTLGIPLHWLVLLALSLAYPLWETITKGVKIKKSRPSKKNTVPWQTAAGLLAASVVFAVALAGSFTYPYLEDGDSWEHAVGTKYVSLYHTYVKPEGVYVSHYLPPYPPSYDALMGVIHQLNSHLQWTLKAFNAILVGLTIVYAYYFTRKYASSQDVAAYSVIFLSAAPAFGSHTIWSHTIGIAVMYPVFHAILLAKTHPWFARLSVFLLAGGMVTQPLVSMVIGILYVLYMVSHSLYNRREFKTLFMVGALAFALAMAYWAPSVIEYGAELKNVDRVGGEVMELNFKLGSSSTDAPPGIREIIFPLPVGDMYMQHGFGLLYSLLMFSAVIYVIAEARKSKRFLREKQWLLTALLWLTFAFIGLEAIALPLSVYPARFWGLVPIGGSMLAAYITVEILRKVKAAGGNPRTIALIIVGLVLLTSGYYKIQVQLKQLPSDIGAHLDKNIQSYVNLGALKPDTKVYPVCLEDKFVIGMDKLSMPWDPGVVAFRRSILSKTPQEMHEFLKNKGYEYAIVESYCVKRCAEEALGGPSDSQPTEKLDAARGKCIADFSKFLTNLRRYDGLALVYADNKTGMFKVK